MAPKWTIYISWRWKWPKAIWVLLVLEIPLSIAALALFGIADPNTYRTKLWQNGSNEGFNSDPTEILYDFANYRPAHTPLIWSQYMTQFNVVCAILSMFILLVKSTLFVLHGFLPIISVFVHAILVALYAVATSNQSTPDLSNKDVPNLQKNLPWYLSKGCGFASDKNHGYCMQARASFGVTCTMLGLFVIYFALAIHSAIITKEELAENKADYDEDIEMKQIDSVYDPYHGLSESQRWEAQRQMFNNMPKTPATPMTASGMPLQTPRTKAFNVLSGSNGESSAFTEERAPKPKRKPLAFRVLKDIKDDIM